ncbi:unnamed protein product [Paramecium primaurelia]|uniref:Transmembrane protein n=1 Tax=Paramecium primaurelia TaxID=5886 RepID=A0A8S1MPW6_PARPR|nr:unnamed protein product [Paramecium primaurelia]CAD8083101.1 unnamed protein product [Paramecium primaurelia]
MGPENNSVDTLLYLSKVLTKNKKRTIKIISFLGVMLLFVSCELIINGECFITQKNNLEFLVIDSIMYFGIFGICFFELRIQIKKMNKKYINQIRMRAIIYGLSIYIIFVIIIICLSLYHILVQSFFFFFYFNEECFYLKNKTQYFVPLKITIFCIFIIVEIVIIFFLKWVFQQSFKAFIFPYKSRRTLLEFRSESHDIVPIINQIQACSP